MHKLAGICSFGSDSIRGGKEMHQVNNGPTFIFQLANEKKKEKKIEEEMFFIALFRVFHVFRNIPIRLHVEMAGVYDNRILLVDPSTGNINLLT